MTRPAFEPGKLASVGKVVQMRVNAIASLAVAALLALTLVAVALRGQGQAHVELAQDSTAGAGSRSLGHARQSGTPPDKAQSLVHRDLPGYIPGRGRERDLVAGSSAYRPPDTSQAPHDTVADRGSWWGDNDAWYDGWTQHKQDMQKPRYNPFTDDGEKAYKDDLDVAPFDYDSEGQQRTPMATTYADDSPQYRQNHLLEHGMTENPPQWRFQSRGDGTSDTVHQRPLPPWCDRWLGCPAPYDRNGNLQWQSDYPSWPDSTWGGSNKGAPSSLAHREPSLPQPGAGPKLVMARGSRTGATRAPHEGGEAVAAGQQRRDGRNATAVAAAGGGGAAGEGPPRLGTWVSGPKETRARLQKYQAGMDALLRDVKGALSRNRALASRYAATFKRGVGARAAGARGASEPKDRSHAAIVRRARAWRARHRAVLAAGGLRVANATTQLPDLRGTGQAGWMLLIYEPTSVCDRNPGNGPVCGWSSTPHDWTDLVWKGQAVVPAVDFGSHLAFRAAIPLMPDRAFYMLLYGRLVVRQADTYTFCSSSRDGLRLFVDGALWLDDDGNHHPRRTCRPIPLIPGRHDLRVDGYRYPLGENRHGAAAKRLTWWGKDTGGHEQVVPSMDASSFKEMYENHRGWDLRVYPYYQHGSFARVPDDFSVTRAQPMPYEDYTPLAFANVPEFGDARGELRPADAMTETIVPTLGNMVFTLGGRTKIVRDGKYTWCLAGVGGARLRVNSEWIVDFDDGGNPGSGCKEIDMPAGPADILTVSLRTGTTPASFVSLSYSGPDTAFQPRVPASQDANVVPAKHDGFRMYLFELARAAPVAPAWQVAAQGQVCNWDTAYYWSNNRWENDVPRYCEYSWYVRYSDQWQTIIDYCCFTPQIASRFAARIEAVVPAISFSGVAAFHKYTWSTWFGFSGRQFGFVFYGTVLIENEGHHTICLESRDGARLWLNDFTPNNIAVNCDGKKHHAHNACGTFYLYPGRHRVKVDGFVDELSPHLIVRLNGHVMKSIDAGRPVDSDVRVDRSYGLSAPGAALLASVNASGNGTTGDAAAAAAADEAFTPLPPGTAAELALEKGGKWVRSALEPFFAVAESAAGQAPRQAGATAADAVQPWPEGRASPPASAPVGGARAEARGSQAGPPERDGAAVSTAGRGQMLAETAGGAREPAGGVGAAEEKKLLAWAATGTHGAGAGGEAGAGGGGDAARSGSKAGDDEKLVAWAEGGARGGAGEDVSVAGGVERGLGWYSGEPLEPVKRGKAGRRREHEWARAGRAAEKAWGAAGAAGARQRKLGMLFGASSPDEWRRYGEHKRPVTAGFDAFDSGNWTLDAHDDKGMPVFEPSFYYDGVSRGEWHDGWRDYSADFDSGKDGSAWKIRNRDPQAAYGTDGPWGEEGWSRARSDLQAPYPHDFGPQFDKDHPDWGRVRTGYGPGRPEGRWPGSAGSEGFSEADTRRNALEAAGERGQTPEADTMPRVSMLPPGGFLSSEQYELSFLKSEAYGEYALVCHEDGDLTLYYMGMPEAGSSSRTGGFAVWSSNSAHRAPGPFRCLMQTDGNLVVYSRGVDTVWSSGTSGRGANSGAWNKLRLRQDGLLEIVDRWGARVWSVVPREGAWGVYQPH